MSDVRQLASINPNRSIMNLPRLFYKVRRILFDKTYRHHYSRLLERKRRLKSALHVAKSPVLTVQERISVVCKVVTEFEVLYGYAPQQLYRILTDLNNDLTRKVRKSGQIELA